MNTTQVNPAKKKKFPEIDALKGIAIIGVVILHMSFDSRLSLSALEIVETLQLIFSWSVLAFFFCSGFLQKPIVDIASLKSVIKKRMKRLIVPSLSFSITYKILMMAIAKTGFFSWDFPIPTTIQELMAFLLMPISPQFYFLYFLFAISILHLGLELLLSKKVYFWGVSFIFPLIYIFISIPESLHGPDNRLLPIYFLSYVFGYFLGIHEKEQTNKLIIFALIPITIAILLTKNLLFLALYIPALCFWTLKYLPEITNLFNKTQLGKYSSGIYVWHAPILLPFMSIISVKIIGGGWYVLIPLLSGTIGICVGLSILTQRFEFLRLWRF